jgi:hypothetical protein
MEDLENTAEEPHALMILDKLDFALRNRKRALPFIPSCIGIPFAV